MIRQSSTSRVIDSVTGQSLSTMTFANVLSVLDRIEHAEPVCTRCGTPCGSAAIHPVATKGGGWELQFPHECREQEIPNGTMSRLAFARE